MSFNGFGFNTQEYNFGNYGPAYTLSLGLSQTVILNDVYTLTGTIEQTVTAVYTLGFTLDQRVEVLVPASGSIRWAGLVRIDGTIVTNLTGVVVVEGGENEARLASFEIYPDTGAFTWTDYIAKTVTVDYYDNTGVYERLFTGIVDEVKYDVQTNRALFSCTNNRKELIGSQSKTQIKAALPGSRYSSYIFNEEAENYEYASDLLTTVFATYETDAKNIFRMVPFAAKATADKVYTGDDDIIDGSLNPTFVSRDRLINKVNLNFGYRFKRLRHRERTYTWNMLNKPTGNSDGYNSWAEFLQKPSTFCPRDAVESAVLGSGWALKGDISFTALPAAGYYSGVGWTPRQTTIVTDDQGRERRTVTDISGVYTTGATFTIAKRFAQMITEAYAITIEATQSTTLFGDIAEERSYTMEASYDHAGWEDFTQYRTPTGTLSQNGDYIIDNKSTLEGGLTEFQNAIQTAQAIEYRKIKNTHRQNFVDFNILLDPTVDLHRTLEVSSTPVQARGKVVNFVHRMEIDTETPKAITSVRLGISKASGSASETTIVTPASPANNDATFVPIPLILETHLGNSYASRAYDDTWSGWLSNYKYQDFISATLPRYPTAFVLDTQKISDEDRQARNIPKATTAIVEIPDELLTVVAP